MCIMCAHQESTNVVSICPAVPGFGRDIQYYRHHQQEFLSGRVLVPVVDLLPHVQVVVGPRVELEWYSLNPMEHKE